MNKNIKDFLQKILDNGFLDSNENIKNEAINILNYKKPKKFDMNIEKNDRSLEAWANVILKK